MERHDDSVGRLRLANLLAALSLETDLAMGHPPEEAMRTCLLATGLARRMGIAEDVLDDVYWTSLLMHVGCTAYAHEQAALFGGDEIAVNAIGSKIDDADPRDMLAFLRELTQAMSPLQRGRIVLNALTRGNRFGQEVSTATCEVATIMASRLGLRPSVGGGFGQLFERWDGRGAPQKLSGEAISLPVRVAQVAAQAVVFDRIGGVDAAIAMARTRAGSALDPLVADAFAKYARDLLPQTNEGDPLERVVEAEPRPRLWIEDGEVDRVARAFGEVVDLKSVYTLRHSTAVAELAEAAGRAMGLSHDDVVALRRSGYLHDIGRVGVPNGTWEKSGPLTSAEREHVRLHPYHSERILSRSPALAYLAETVGMHHERLDGTGYYRRATAASIPLTARILAVADEFEGLTQDRAHRPGLSPAAAADHIASEASAGRLDAQVVDAVLSVAGQAAKQPVRQGWPRGLTDREVDVLRCLARGLSNRETGRRLFISSKTVGRHVEHIYGKLGISSRAAAALFAMQHGLLHGAVDHSS